MPASPLDDARRRLNRQLNYLRMPLAPSRTVCSVCRGPKYPAEQLCSRCTNHRAKDRASQLADSVMSISYAFQHHPQLNQHSWTLWNYKNKSSFSHDLKRQLTDLFHVFLYTHAHCISRSLGGRPDWYTTVPSSSSRVDHPLREIVRISSLERLSPVISPHYSARDRQFQPDTAFHALKRDLSGSRGLIVDDTWVTGNTVQALAHRLKQDGAAAVLILTLGRWADLTRPGWRPLIERAVTASPVFDVNICSNCHS